MAAPVDWNLASLPDLPEQIVEPAQRAEDADHEHQDAADLNKTQHGAHHGYGNAPCGGLSKETGVVGTNLSSMKASHQPEDHRSLNELSGEPAPHPPAWNVVEDHQSPCGVDREDLVEPAVEDGSGMRALIPLSRDVSVEEVCRLRQQIEEQRPARSYRQEWIEDGQGQPTEGEIAGRTVEI
jgi:hypothetical protein